MSTHVSIKKSTTGLWVQTIILGFTAVVFGFIGIILIDYLLSTTGFRGTYLKALLLLGLAMAWVLAVLALWLRRGVSSYTITPDSLLVQSRQGLLGTVQSEYRFDSVSSLHLHQGYFGRKFGYGDIHVGTSKDSHKIILKDIDRPEEQLKVLKQCLAANS